MVSETFRLMHVAGVEPDVVSCTSIISGLVQNFQNNEAFDTFKQMVERGMYASSATISSLLPPCVTTANFRHGKDIHGYAMVSGVEEDIFVSCALVDMYAKCGFIYWWGIDFHILNHVAVLVIRLLSPSKEDHVASVYHGRHSTCPSFLTSPMSSQYPKSPNPAKQFTSPIPLDRGERDSEYSVSYSCNAISIWHWPHVTLRSSATASLFGCSMITPQSSYTFVKSPYIKDSSPFTRGGNWISLLNLLLYNFSVVLLSNKFISISFPRQRGLERPHPAGDIGFLA